MIPFIKNSKNCTNLQWQKDQWLLGTQGTVVVAGRDKMELWRAIHLLITFIVVTVLWMCTCQILSNCILCVTVHMCCNRYTHCISLYSIIICVLFSIVNYTSVRLKTIVGTMESSWTLENLTSKPWHILSQLYELGQITQPLQALVFSSVGEQQ